MLPIGVVIPTRNAAQFLPGHLAMAKAWTGEVEEVVVVDSFSEDGTPDLLKAGLRHPHVKILNHPPGLYQSWNFGISQVNAEFCYISTVGDSITLEGLTHLAEVMGRTHCDVVISAPSFVDEAGRPMKPWNWPVHDILRRLNAVEPVVLEGAALFLFTLLHYRNAILGSSASNLYRTRCLRQRPFPTEYGTAGDGGWCLEHCLDIRLAATPKTFSTFLDHPKSYSKTEYQVDELAGRMLDRIRRRWLGGMASDAAFAALSKEIEFDRIVSLLQEKLRWQQELERQRCLPGAWALRPRAWRARFRREAVQRELEPLIARGMARLFGTGAAR